MIHDLLCTAKNPMGESEAVLFVRYFGLCTTLSQNARQIFDGEKGVSGGILSSSEGEEFFDERWMVHRLVGLLGCVKPWVEWHSKRLH